MSYIRKQLENLGKITEYGVSVKISNENGGANTLTLHMLEYLELKLLLMKQEARRTRQGINLNGDKS